VNERTQGQIKTETARKEPFPSLAARTNLLQRKCACGGTPGIDGECAECRKRRLQRRASDRVEPETVSPIVHETLRSPGRPLDADTRAYVEPHFAHDFSKVRIHTDEKATASALAVNALAYTVGRDVVFGAGQYAPRTGEGQRLLAHELTHVVQQREASPNTNMLVIAPATGPAEAEADRAAHAISAGNSIDAQPRRVTGPTLARQAPAFRPPTPAFRPPTRPPTSEVEPEVEPRDPLAGQGGPRYAPSPYDYSLEAAMARFAIRDYRERIRLEQERPVATLDRGGQPPNFITEHGSRRYDWLGGPGGGGSVTVRDRRFHVLDFIEHHAEHARDEDALVRVYEEWVQPYPAPQLPFPLNLRDPSTFPLLGLLDTPKFPPGLDPGSQQRREAYARGAAKRRSRTQPEPKPQEGPKVGPAAAPQTQEEEEKQRRKGGAYPICWPADELLPDPKYRTGMFETSFVRIKGAERDEQAAYQERVRARRRAEGEPDFNPRRFHVHHVIPLFLGGPDWLAVNSVLWPALAHVRGHAVLRKQRQLQDATLTAPLPPINEDLYAKDHKTGTLYYFAGYKGSGRICGNS
jgi:Domain of unknown function (DUF4157)